MKLIKPISVSEAKKLGFVVDTHVYPHLAYKGERFGVMTHSFKCYPDEYVLMFDTLVRITSRLHEVWLYKVIAKVLNRKSISYNQMYNISSEIKEKLKLK